jgi:hypothetical protein
MAITLTYTRKKPVDGDRGSVFWDILADNIVLDDAHTHDGITSPAVPSLNITKGSSTVTNSGWTAEDDWYYKTITMPGTYTLGNCQISFFLNGGTLTGNEFFPKYVRVTNNSFKLYLPVDNQAVDILYT